MANYYNIYIHLYFCSKNFRPCVKYGNVKFLLFQLMFELHFSAHINNVCSLTSFFFYIRLSISATFCKIYGSILGSKFILWTCYTLNFSLCYFAKLMSFTNQFFTYLVPVFLYLCISVNWLVNQLEGGLSCQRSYMCANYIFYNEKLRNFKKRSI